jgi:riboflavin biosynthesis pyrimidine reductase
VDSPVIIVTTAEAAGRAELRKPLEDAGAEIEVARDGTFRAALERLAARDIGSLMLEAAPRCTARRGTRAWSISSAST